MNVSIYDPVQEQYTCNYTVLFVSQSVPRSAQFVLLIRSLRVQHVTVMDVLTNSYLSMASVMVSAQILVVCKMTGLQAGFLP